jgi:hypothetical protein
VTLTLLTLLTLPPTLYSYSLASTQTILAISVLIQGVLVLGGCWHGARMGIVYMAIVNVAVVAAGVLAVGGVVGGWGLAVRGVVGGGLLVQGVGLLATVLVHYRLEFEIK